jgi:VWFA-related protein
MRRPIVTAVLGVFLFTLTATDAANAANAADTTRTVYVTVVDDKGQAVPGLTAEDFGVKEAGKDRVVTSVEPARAKLRIALMVEETLVPMVAVRSGLADFIKRMYQDAEMSLVVVSQRNMTAVDFTSDPNALIAGINGLTLSQQRVQTMVPEGVFEMAKNFEKTKPERPVIVLIALETQQVSAEEPQNVLNQLGRSRAMMSVVSMEGGGNVSAGVGSQMDMAGRAQVMGDGSKQSGGRRIEVAALTAMPRALQQVADDLSAQYLITYTLPDGVKPSDRLNVTLKKKGPTLRAPTKVSDK